MHRPQIDRLLIFGGKGDGDAYLIRHHFSRLSSLKRKVEVWHGVVRTLLKCSHFAKNRHILREIFEILKTMLF